MEILEQSQYKVEENRIDYVTQQGERAALTVTWWPDNHGVTVYLEDAAQLSQTFSLTLCEVKALLLALQFLPEDLEGDNDA